MRVLAWVLMVACQAVSEEILTAVRAAVDSTWVELPEADRGAVSQRLGATLLGAPPAARARLLAELPDALAFHAEVLRTHAVPVLPPLPEVPAPPTPNPDFLRKGYAIQTEYLDERVRRAARRREDGPTLRAIETQIGILADGVRDALRDQLLGDAGRDYVDRLTGRLRKAWLSSIETRFNAFMDEPLPPGELTRIISELRSVSASFDPVLLGAAEFSEEEKLRSRGVLDLVERVKEAAYGATRSCFRTFDPHEAALARWREVADVEVKRSIASIGTVGERSVLTDPNVGSVKPLPRTDVGSSGPGASESHAGPWPDVPVETSKSSTGVLALVVGAVAGILVVVGFRRRA